MSYFVDIGGTPASEPCAQLGQTPEFDRLNALEVLAYRYAIIARYGPPPPGCHLSGRRQRHDFGCYMTLVLQVNDDEDAAVQAYADAVEEGLDTWLEAGFRAPVDYDGASPVGVQADPVEILVSAFHITRPDGDGFFPLAEFETLHRNLALAFPIEAAVAAARLITGPVA